MRGGGKHNLLKVVFTFCLILIPTSAKAASINILNPSFENPVAPLQPDGQFYTVGSISDWTLNPSDTQGVFNPSASQISTGGNTYYNQPVPDGNQVAFSNGGTISQQLSTVLQPNSQYTLGVSVGRRNNVSFPGYNIELLAGSTVLASNSSVIPNPGTFILVAVNYISGNSGSLIGQPLGIRLSSPADQVNFDDVTLDVTSTPEPSSVLGLMSLGILGVGSTLKRKFSK